MRGGTCQKSDLRGQETRDRHPTDSTIASGGRDEGVRARRKATLARPAHQSIPAGCVARRLHTAGGMRSRRALPVGRLGTPVCLTSFVGRT
jgi:hypothetical protein